VRQKAAQGFTLIEMLVAMTIMGLALSLVLPLSQRSLERAQSQVELSRLSQLLKNASRRAFVEGATVVVLGEDARLLLEGSSASGSYELAHHRLAAPVVLRFDRWGMPDEAALRLVNARTGADVQVNTR
jgi:prepilin-type N-terminal cleavage/methylation domain-containing protein